MTSAPSSRRIEDLAALEVEPRGDLAREAGERVVDLGEFEPRDDVEARHGAPLDPDDGAAAYSAHPPGPPQREVPWSDSSQVSPRSPAPPPSSPTPPRAISSPATKPASSWPRPAARYGLVHAAALLALAALLRDAPPGPPRAWLAASGWCFAAALLLFCGGLYLRAAGAGPAVTPLVPAGGTLFIAGWAALLVAALWPRPPG